MRYFIDIWKVHKMYLDEHKVLKLDQKKIISENTRILLFNLYFCKVSYFLFPTDIVFHVL